MSELSAQTPRHFRDGCEAMALDDVLTAIWRKLSHAVGAPSSAWRLPVLSSISENGPDLRTVVLRGLDADSWSLTCYTDSRSTKVRQLTVNPRVSWLFYCPEERIQLRAFGVASIATSGREVTKAWDSVPALSRQNYLTDDPPGTMADSPVVVGCLDRDADVFADGINSFAVLRCTLSELVWLSVDGARQVSAVFKQTENGVASAWRVP
jgi:pyridoxamine 5'-phosphate oxidase